MALTDKTTEDSSSDGFVEVETPKVVELTEKGEEEQEGAAVENAEAEVQVTEGNTLNASSLEEHNKNMAGKEIQQCTNPSPSNVTGDDDGSEAKTKVGAGVLFGLSGLLLGGPLLGLLAGAGGAYVASDVDGPAGDAARSAGDFAVNTGEKVGEAAKEANEKHGILDKIKEAFVNLRGKVKEFDEEHKIGEKAKETATNIKDKTVEFEQKHHVAENILTGIQNGINFLLGKVREATSEGPCSGDNSENKITS